MTLLTFLQNSWFQHHAGEMLAGIDRVAACWRNVGKRIAGYFLLKLVLIFVYVVKMLASVYKPHRVGILVMILYRAHLC